MEQFAALVANMPTNEDAFLLFNILVNNFLRLEPIINWKNHHPFLVNSTQTLFILAYVR